MNRVLLLVLAGLAICSRLAPLPAQESADAYFQQRVKELAEATQRELASVTPDTWPETQARWREELREMLGIPKDLPKTDLKQRVVGSVTAEGVTIDRLHYQSRPGLYVAANLYRPLGDPPEQGWPAVLYVCGHARAGDHGRSLGNKTNYQYHGLWLARHGIACLMIDTIQLGEFHGEHHGTYKLGRWDWISRGYTPGGVEAWNAIRGIDLLCDLPDIDEQRIGITGRSGGGAYSWFAAALDERIQVAIPVAGITDLQNHVVDGCVEGHCDCMYFVNYYGWDYGKLAALIAPRPLLLENSDSDGIFPLDGVLRVERQVRQLYEQLGAADNYGLVITPGPHKDTEALRVPAFQWFLKHLTDQEQTIATPSTKEVAATRLAVFEREIPRDERVTTVAGWFAPAATPTLAAADALAAWRAQWRPALEDRRLLRKAASLQPNSLHQGRSGNHRWELLEDPSSGLRLLRVDPAAAQASKPIKTVVHLLLNAAGEPKPVWQEWVAADRVQQRLAAFPEHRHYFVSSRVNHWDLAGADGADSQPPSVHARHQWVRRFYLLGETPASVALADLRAALDWLGTDQESSISLAATGREALLAVLAALLDRDAESPKLSALVLDAHPTDASLMACLPGVLQICTPDSLLAAAQAALPVETRDLSPLSPPLLVDSAIQPQQATGMRIVEVTPSSARIWVRATRWPLPNLADLPEVAFQQPAGKQSRGAILPESGVDGLAYGVPGVAAEVRVLYRSSGQSEYQATPWQPVDASTDYSGLVALQGLAPGRRVDLRTQVRQPGSERIGSSLTGSFETLPDEQVPATFRLAIGTCQGFVDRDGPHGFDMYRSIAERDTDAFIMAGDVVYYDALARTPELAFYHWQRTYGLPTLVEFHRRVPTYFLKDDHDTYVNDSWPGGDRDWTGDFRFADGQAIFPTQTGLPTPAYRTFSIGSDLQLWLMEGRDFRTPNNEPDGPHKTIWGAQQKAWLQATLEASSAKFKVIVSPTPIVGPDRKNKKDNHANEGFAVEGTSVRQLLAAHPNTVSVCGDRHWQFHSIDPDTGLHEFSVGPASDRHAGGWKQSDFRPEIHQFLRVAGGYLELELAEAAGKRRLILRHLDTHGSEHHRHVLH